jgi:hypothetical protein
MAHDRVSPRIRGAACATLADQRLDQRSRQPGPAEERRFEIELLATAPRRPASRSVELG